MSRAVVWVFVPRRSSGALYLHEGEHIRIAARGNGANKEGLLWGDYKGVSTEAAPAQQHKGYMQGTTPTQNTSNELD